MDQARRQGSVCLYYARVNGWVKAGEDKSGERPLNLMQITLGAGQQNNIATKGMG